MDDRSESHAFLFSDIEASTRRWESDPEAMARDLALHDELIRDRVQVAGGEVFSHTGDGMCAVFPAAPAAIEAAVAIQLAMAASSWSGASPLRIRMAVHTGAVQRRAGNYFGPTLNRTARLMAVGSGGQILCSHAAAEQLGHGQLGHGQLAHGQLGHGRLGHGQLGHGQLGEGQVGEGQVGSTGLDDLGEHRLADLARPERVFQVTHPDLEAAFPPLRSLGLHRHNLPVALTPFVGRTFELKELDEMLDESRLLSLIGAGGAGKTRLALQVAAGAVERFPDGVWIAELAAVRDEALIAAALAAGLGLDTAGLATAEEVTGLLTKFLAGKRALLVFDNCEHLVDAVAGLIHELLSRCPRITVLATSQEPLGLPEEAAWRIPPLSLPGRSRPGTVELMDSDAVVFFLDRVRAARRGFELTAANGADVARICRRLDGIPLALELAAARVPVLGVHQVAERLDDRFRLLTGSARTAVPRHQTLRAALDWSFGLLSPAEQAALRSLAVFPACFSIDAAEAMLADPSGSAAGPGGPAISPGGDDPVHLLTRLVDKSLVVVSDEDAEQVRYRLAESVRQYARERLAEAGEERAAGRRHRDFFLSLTTTWGSQLFDDERVNRVTADEDNIRAALEWSWAEGEVEAALHLVAALWVHWVFGNQTGAREWLERIVARTAHVEDVARLEALYALAVLLPGASERQPALLSEAAELARRLGDPEAQAGVDFGMGDVALHAGDVAAARALLESSLSGYERIGGARGVGYCHDALGWVCVAEGDLRQARVHFERAAELARENGSEWLAAQALSALASLSVLAGDAESGLRLARQAIAAGRRVPIRLVLVMVMVRAGEAAVLAADLTRATVALTEALWLISDLGTERYLGDCLELVALTQLSRGEHREAAVMFGASAARHLAERGAGGVARLVADEARKGRGRATDALGPELFDRYAAEGHALSPEEAIKRALANLPTKPGPHPTPSVALP